MHTIHASSLFVTSLPSLTNTFLGELLHYTPKNQHDAVFLLPQRHREILFSLKGLWMKSNHCIQFGRKYRRCSENQVFRAQYTVYFCCSGDLLASQWKHDCHKNSGMVEGVLSISSPLQSPSFWLVIRGASWPQKPSVLFVLQHQMCFDEAKSVQALRVNKMQLNLRNVWKCLTFFV